MKLAPEDGPFSKSRLIEIVRYYYPAMEYAESRASSGEELVRIEQSTPEWQARDKAHTRAMAHRGPWRELVKSLGDALPDYHVTDRTIWYLTEPAYLVELDPRDETRGGMLVGMVSVIAPLYFICERVADRTLNDPISDRHQAATDALERAILARYPYHRLAHDVGHTKVAGLRARGLQYGETTLIDLLFSPY